MLALDHLAVVCERLEDGVAHVEAALGVALGPGGRHPLMSTHNRLLGLGPGLYLEVLAVDPDAPDPGRVRWYDMDGFSGAPRLTHWICRTDDLDLALDATGAGRAVEMARGNLRWRMGITDDGRLPLDDTHPALIEWRGDGHPSDRLPDAGCRLRRLTVASPHAAELSELGMTDPRAKIVQAPEKSLIAEIETPNGVRRLA